MGSGDGGREIYGKTDRGRQAHGKTGMWENDSSLIIIQLVAVPPIPFSG